MQAKTLRAPILNRWLTADDGFKRFLPSSKWGYACPILAGAADSST
jgi:hypothetical protein